MKKRLFFLTAALMLAVVSFAQALPSAITFTAVSGTGTLNDSTFKAEDLTLKAIDPDGKMAIDANAAKFSDDGSTFVDCAFRLKTGGKTNEGITKNYMKLTIAKAGKLVIGVRTGSNSAVDRTLVVKAGDTEIYNHAITETELKDSVEVEEVKTYFYHPISIYVPAGELKITYPVNGLNFYYFSLEEDAFAVTMTGGTPVLNTGFKGTANNRGGFIVKNDGVFFCDGGTGFMKKADLSLTGITTESDSIGKGYYMDIDDGGNIIIYAWTGGSKDWDVAQVYAPDYSLIRVDSLPLLKDNATGDQNGRCDMPTCAGNLVTGRGAYFAACNASKSVLRYNYLNGVRTSIDTIPVSMTMAGNNTVAPLDVDHFYVQSRGNGLLYVDCSGATPTVTRLTYFNANTMTSAYGGKAFKLGTHTYYVMGTYKVGAYGGSFAVYDVTDPANPYQVAEDKTTIGSSTMGTACVTFRVVVEDNVAHIYEYARFHVRKYDLSVPVINFNVTVPANTSMCYVAGNFNGWTTMDRMTKVNDNTFTYTCYNPVVDKNNVQYKYCAGNGWDYVEKNSDGSERGNRTWAANDVVARWLDTQDIFTVTYDANGGTGDAPVDDTEYIEGVNTTVTVLGKGALTYGNCTFTGWNTAADGSGTPYAEDATFNITANTTLYAQWLQVVTVHFTYTGDADWSNTKAYVWLAATDVPKVDFPGEAVTANATHAGWVDFEVEYPAYDRILFNNGNNGYGNQTADIVIDGSESELFVASNGWQTDSKVTVHTNADGYATFYGDARSAVPAGITNVYTATYTSGTYLTLNDEAQFLSNGIPAHVGVIIKGEADTDYVFAYDWSAAGASDNINSLVGTVAEYGRNTQKVTYVLSRQNDETAFYKYEGDKIPAHKAYLELAAEAQAPIIRIIGEATNINNIEAVDEAVKFIQNGKFFIKKNGVVYNVMGAIVK